MNKKFKGIISTLLFIAILLFVSFRYGPTDQTNADDNSRSSQVKKNNY